MVAAFAWFVVISWDVLSRAMGFAPLIVTVALAATVTLVWAAMLVARARRPRRSLSGPRRIAVAGASILAAVTGLVAVPTTRARLETNKCRYVAAADPLSQAACRSWLESRRQWWTLGLSHKNGIRR
jgi:hypothetical protein